jgi:alcohol dehydrogenase (cytochrome c)
VEITDPLEPHRRLVLELTDRDMHNVTAYLATLPGGNGPTGMLTTAGGLLFAGDGAGNLVAFDAATGTPRWHTRLGSVTNAPQAYMLDGKQYILAAAGDMLYAFRLN